MIKYEITVTFKNETKRAEGGCHGFKKYLTAAGGNCQKMPVMEAI